MADKQSEHNRGQSDGSAYKNSGTISQVVGENYNPPSNPSDKAAYDKGHANGRK